MPRLTGEDDPKGPKQFVVRLPPGLHEKIAAQAAASGRSMNSEIVAALEKHVEDDDSLSELYRMVEKLQSEVRDHESRINELEGSISFDPHD